MKKKYVFVVMALLLGSILIAQQSNIEGVVSSYFSNKAEASKAVAEDFTEWRVTDVVPSPL